MRIEQRIVCVYLTTIRYYGDLTVNKRTAEMRAKEL